MRALLLPLNAADYRFLVGVIRGSRYRTLEALVEDLEATGDEDAREELVAHLEHEIRYLGSSGLSYQLRKAVGGASGASLRSIIRDVAQVLKVPLRRGVSDRALLKGLAEDYATAEFARLDPTEQQSMLENLGVGRQEAAAFLKRGAAVFAVPVMIEAFGLLVVQGLIKTVIFGIIARIVGQQLASRLLAFLFSKAPWWVGWISPTAWALSIGWTAITLQGPTRRKTVPVMLYLGLCCIREDLEPVQTPEEARRTADSKGDYIEN